MRYWLVRRPPAKLAGAEEVLLALLKRLRHRELGCHHATRPATDGAVRLVAMMNGVLAP